MDRRVTLSDLNNQPAAQKAPAGYLKWGTQHETGGTGAQGQGGR